MIQIMGFALCKRMVFAHCLNTPFPYDSRRDFVIAIPDLVACFNPEVTKIAITMRPFTGPSFLV